MAKHYNAQPSHETPKENLVTPELTPSPDKTESAPSDQEERNIDAPLETSQSVQQQPQTKKKIDFKAFLRTKKGKIMCVAAVLLLIVIAVFCIPASRYAVAGLVIKKDATVIVTDTETGKPVSAADVTLGSQTVKTDANGKVTLKNVQVGPWQVSVKKTYYQDTSGSTLVPIMSGQQALHLQMQATGRQVPIKTINKLTGAVLGGVEVTAGDASVMTAEDGTAVLVLPADKTTLSATFKRDGFNTVTADVLITEQPDDKNTFSLTASGKIYFLSKRTGKIDVMKSDLDGANASVVVAGTGQEEESQTVLLASRDWKYLALQARRDSKVSKLYLVETATDKLSVIDEGDDASFSPVGWSNEYFVYQVNRNNVQAWQPKAQSLKSFNAASGKVTVLEYTDGLGTSSTNWASEVFASTYIIGDKIVYAKYWNNYYGTPALIDGKKDAIYHVNANGDGKQALKQFDAATSSYMEVVIYRPDEIYYKVHASSSKFYEYHDGVVAETTEINDTNFYSQTYNTYLVSPSGKNTFWSEARDGKNVLFVGNADGAEGKELMSSNSFKPYGWFTDNYLLLAKDKSELFIMPRDVPGAEPLKITDYHRPAVSFPGYGYGYGGSY